MMHKCRTVVGERTGDKVRGTDNAVVVRNAERALPCLHLVEHEVATTDHAVRTQILARLVVVVVAAIPGDYSVIAVDRQHGHVGSTSEVAAREQRAESSAPAMRPTHRATSANSRWISSSSVLISASISSNGRGGTYL